MALTLNQINPGTALIGAATSKASSSSSSSFGGFSAGSSVASSLAAQFVERQASLIYGRYSSSDRVFIQQGIQNRAQALERSARDLFLRGDGASIFNQSEVEVSDPSVLSATADQTASPFGFSIEVSKLAQAQQVVSDELTDEDDDFSNGDEDFELTVNGTTYEMTIDIQGSDDNIDVLNLLADEFNAQAGSVVTAQVVSDSESGTSYLALTAGSTGTNAGLTLSGDILEDINLDTAVAADSDAGTGGLVTSAQDATYAIDAGTTVTSQSNTIRLFDNSVNVVLAATTDGDPVSVEVRADASAIEEELAVFVDAYNDALSFALALPSEATTPYALELNAAVAPFTNRLESIGVERGSDGKLSIDSEKLSAALGDGRFARVSASFTGAAGLATATQRASRNLLDAGGAFLTQPTNPVESSALLAVNRYQNLGMIVDLLS